MPTPPGEQVLKCPECGSHNVGQKERPKRRGEGSGWDTHAYDIGVNVCCGCGIEFALDFPGTEPDGRQQ